MVRSSSSVSLRLLVWHMWVPFTWARPSSGNLRGDTTCVGWFGGCAWLGEMRPRFGRGCFLPVKARPPSVALLRGPRGAGRPTPKHS